MKKVISLVVVLAMLFTLSIAALPASAALNTADYYAVNTTTNSNAYALGPTFVMNKDTGMFAQAIEFKQDVVGLAFGCWEKAKDGSSTVDISFYEYGSDIASSIAGTAVQTITVTVKEGQYGGGVSDYGVYELGSKLPAGDYVVVFENTTDEGFHMGLGTATDAVYETYAENANSALGGDQAICVTFFTEMPSDLISASQIKPGKTELTQDITGALSVSTGTYVIDLKGHKWSHTSTVLTVDGDADVTVIDTVGGGLIYANNDAICPNGGKVTLDGISVNADSSGCDAVFTKGGVTVIKNCTLDAQQSSVHNDNSNGATVSVINCKLNGADVALKARNNGVITISGDTVFTNTEVEMQRGFSADKTAADTFVAGEGCTIEFDSVGGDATVVNVTNYVNTVEPDEPVEPNEPVNPDEPGDVETGDVMSFVFIVAAAALVVTVISKKRAF